MGAGILIVIPAYNEAGNIGAVLQEVRRSVPDLDVVVIDDGSTDQTRQVVQGLGVACVRHPYNLGYGAAVQTGLRFAGARGYGELVLMDGDGQHDASQIPGLIDALHRTGADLVIGSRFVAKTGYRVPALRRMGMVFFSALTWALTGVRVRDVTSGFQALGRRAITFLAEEYPVDYPDAETVILLSRSGLRLSEHRVEVKQRTHGVSMHSGGRLLYYPIRALLGVTVVMLRTVIRGGRLR